MAIMTLVSMQVIDFPRLRRQKCQNETRHSGHCAMPLLRGFSRGREISQDAGLAPPRTSGMVKLDWAASGAPSGIATRHLVCGDLES
jgi:hypothetical protein